MESVGGKMIVFKKFGFIILAVINFFILFLALDTNYSLKSIDILYIIILLLFLASIRIIDDIEDYKKDALVHKDWLSKKTLIISEIVVLITVITLSVFAEIYFVIPFFLLSIILQKKMFLKSNRAEYLKLLIVADFVFINGYILYHENETINIFQWIYLSAILFFNVIIDFLQITKKIKKKKLAELEISVVGGKAYNLIRVSNALIPKFIVIEASFLDSLLYGKKTNDLLDEKMQIKEYLRKKRFIKRSTLYAIRSSALEEDSNENSFAGIMNSYLYVKYEDIIDRVIDVYFSAFTKTAVEYRKNKGIDTKISLAVIIQIMVDADISGVIHTLNPINNNPDEIFMSLALGVGDALVSGAIDSFDYTVNNNKITYKQSDDIPKKLILKIASFAKQVQYNFDTYQDIEFAVKKRKIYLLQSRTIPTHHHLKLSKRLKTLDNSNIIESYYGVVNPLTASFAKEIYQKVYKKGLEEGNIPKKTIDRLSIYLDDMVNEYQGKMYYNLNSWYKLVTIFPNSKANTTNMERMMGVSTSLETKKIKLSSVSLLVFAGTFLYRLIRLKKDIKMSLENFKETTFSYVNTSFSNYNQNQLIELFNNVQKNTMKDYVIPIINDTKTMINFGKLNRYVERLQIENKDDFLSLLLTEQRDIISVEVSNQFNKILQSILSNEAIKNDYLKMDTKSLMEKYIKVNDIQTYIKYYGSRVSNELKLETKTITNHPEILFKMLKNHITSDIKPITITKIEPLINTQLTNYQRKKLNKLKGKVVVNIRDREELRLMRTHMFQAVRNIFLRFSEIFFDLKIIDDRDDIFYLTKDEIFDIQNVNNPKEIIAKRKITEIKNKEYKTYNRIVFYQNAHLEVQEVSLSQSNLLHGLPSGYGIVTGEVLITDSPTDDLIADKIVVTKRTDPGWIVAFPFIKGLIVEKGSVLSHSALVAREMKVPALFNVKEALLMLKSGDMVTIDAIKGEIIIHEK